MKTRDEQIAVEVAYKLGAEIEFRNHEGNYIRPWNLIPRPLWTWGMYEYRVKPTKKDTGVTQKGHVSFLSFSNN